MRRLLVTGAAGFIGANFVYYWMRQHPEDTVVALDALTYAGNEASLDDLKSHPNFTFVAGSIADQALMESLLIEHKLDTIVNFAAESHVDRSIPVLLKNMCMRQTLLTQRVKHRQIISCEPTTIPLV